MAVKPECLKYTLSDGATLGYDIFGVEHLGKGRLPIVLISGRASLKSDWGYLIPSLSQKRPVLVYDHRGMGESTFPSPEREELTIELMARDAVALIDHLGWKDVDILGLSMGGVILQQLLILPSLRTNPTALPFRVHHALLTSTFCSRIVRIAAPSPPPSVIPAPGQALTLEQRKALARLTLDTCFSPKWLALPENQPSYERWLEKSLSGRRPPDVVFKQGELFRDLDLSGGLVNVAPTTKVLVIHGQDDMLVPFSMGEEIVRSLPHARMVERGSRRGQVPSYEFGHLCFEYFGEDIWIGVIESFVDDENDS